MLNDNVFHAMAFHELLCRGMLRIDDLCIVLRKKQINQTYPIQYFNDLPNCRWQQNIVQSSGMLQCTRRRLNKLARSPGTVSAAERGA